MSVPAVSAKPAPSRGRYGLAAVLIVAAIAVAVVFIVYRINAITAGLSQVVVPGQAELRLDKAGSYTIFHEYESVVDGKMYYAMSLSGLRVVVTAPNGAPVELTTPGATGRYNLSGRSGVSVFAFEAAQPGIYRLSAVYDDGRSEPKTVLAVGAGFAASIIVTVLVTLLIMFAGIGAGVAIIVMTALARRRAQQASPAS